jgi:hypothetical protein
MKYEMDIRAKYVHVLGSCLKNANTSPNRPVHAAPLNFGLSTSF